MHVVRAAFIEDLPVIHRMQDIPLRERIMIHPLPAPGEFLARAAVELAAGRESYCLMESGGDPAGFIWIRRPAETCEIWGRHLHTLFHACAWIAFEHLGMRRLCWNVRESNRRMIRVCERFRVRRTSGENRFVISRGFSFVAAGPVFDYEFLPDEFRERLPIIRRHSLPVELRLGPPSVQSRV
jgi:hypothetical protein